MGKIVRCPECGESHRSLERLEDLRDNDSICLVCNAPIEVADWDRVLASYEDDDLDDVDDLEDVEDEESDDDDEEAVEEWVPGDDLEPFEKEEEVEEEVEEEDSLDDDADSEADEEKV